MSTSLLDHGFGIRGYRYVCTDYLEGEVLFKPKKVSALDPAAKVLGEQGKPMNCQEMIEEMSRKKCSARSASYSVAVIARSAGLRAAYGPPFIYYLVNKPTVCEQVKGVGRNIQRQVAKSQVAACF